MKITNSNKQNSIVMYEYEDALELESHIEDMENKNWKCVYKSIFHPYIAEFENLNSTQSTSLYNNDCFYALNNLVNDGIKFDAIITDMPYGTTSCNWDTILNLDEIWKLLKQLRKDNCPIVLFGSEPFTSILISSNLKEYKHQWFWNKKQSGSPQNAKYLPHQIIENIVVFGNGRVNYYPQMVKGKLRKRGGYKESNKIMNEFEIGYSNYSDEYYPTALLEFVSKRTGRFHPTEKPVALMEYLIKTYTNEGDTVLDFTMGSGTTGVACVNTNRNFIGIELDETYFNIAKERIEKAENEVKLSAK